MADLVDSVTAAELAELLAEAWIDGLGEDYMRTAFVRKELNDLFNVLRAANGINISQDDFKTVVECMPPQSRAIRAKRQEPEPEQPNDKTDAWMRRMAGF